MKPNIFIVEDDAELRSGMLSLLRMQGHTVNAATTIADARQQLETLSPFPSHVILDLNLPDGLGTDLLGQIRVQSSGVRVMLLSGSTDTKALEAARELGVNSVATKPPNWDELVQWAGLT